MTLTELEKMITHAKKDKECMVGEKTKIENRLTNLNNSISEATKRINLYEQIRNKVTENIDIDIDLTV